MGTCVNSFTKPHNYPTINAPISPGGQGEIRLAVCTGEVRNGINPAI